MQNDTKVPDRLRRAALMGLAGAALLSTSGCSFFYAIFARLGGEVINDDGSPKKGDKKADKKGDPHLNRNEPKGLNSGDETSDDDDSPPPQPSSDDPPSDDPPSDDPAFGT